MLDVRRLRALREVARRGSIAGAASALGFTPSAVSQQLTKLEQEVGVPLLERGPRSVRLTEAGRALAERADEILTRLAEVEIEVRAAAGAESLRLGSFPTAGAAIVPAALSAIRHMHPALEVTVRELDPLASLARLRDRELDVALLFEYDFVPLPERRGIATHLILEEPLHVVLPRGHPAARKRAIRLEELAREPWIKTTRRSSCHPFMPRACRTAGFEPRVAAEFDDYRAMENLVASGVGVAMAPEMVTRHVGDGVEIRPVAFRPPRRRVYVAWREEDTRDLVQDVVETLEAAARSEERAPGRIATVS